MFRAQPLQPHRTRKAFAFSSARCQSEDVTLSGGSNLSYNVYDSAQRSSAPPCEIVKNFHFPATNSVQKGEVSDPRAGYQRSSVPPLSSAGDRGAYNTYHSFRSAARLFLFRSCRAIGRGTTRSSTTLERCTRFSSIAPQTPLAYHPSPERAPHRLSMQLTCVRSQMPAIWSPPTSSLRWKKRLRSCTPSSSLRASTHVVTRTSSGARSRFLSTMSTRPRSSRRRCS